MPLNPELDGECLASARWGATLADFSRDWPEIFGTEEADKEDALLAKQAEVAAAEKTRLEAEQARAEAEQQAQADEAEVGGNLTLAFRPKADGRGEEREMEGLAARGKK